MNSRPDDDLLSVSATYNAGGLHVLNDAEVLELCPRAGLLRAMHKILRIKPSGLLACGLPCASWVFMNRATSGRRPYRIFGTTKYAYIKKANEHFVAKEF